MRCSINQVKSLEILHDPSNALCLRGGWSDEVPGHERVREPCFLSCPQLSG